MYTDVSTLKCDWDAKANLQQSTAPVKVSSKAGTAHLICMHSLRLQHGNAACNFEAGCNKYTVFDKHDLVKRQLGINLLEWSAGHCNVHSLAQTRGQYNAVHVLLIEQCRRMQCICVNRACLPKRKCSILCCVR